MDGTATIEDLSSLPFIPNAKLKEVAQLITDKEEERLNVLVSSKYAT